jgi:DNA-binding MarR family transcriptional regulator
MIEVELTHNKSVLLYSKDTSFLVLYYLLLQIDSTSYTWYADKIHKQSIMDSVHISQPTLDKHIQSLKERGIIIQQTRGKYLLNKQIFV